MKHGYTQFWYKLRHNENFRYKAGMFRLTALGLAVVLLLAMAVNIFAGERAGGPSYQSKVLGPGGGGGLFNPQINPHDDDNFIMTTDMGGSFTTVDGGKSFVENNLYSNNTSSAKYAFDPHDADTVYAFNAHLWVSHNKGISFSLLYPKQSNISEFTSGLQTGVAMSYYDNAKRPQSTIMAMAFDPEDPQVLYYLSKPADAGSCAELVRSTDRGETWKKLMSFPKGLFYQAPEMPQEGWPAGPFYYTMSQLAHVQLYVDPQTARDAREITVLSSDGVYRVDAAGSMQKISNQTARFLDMYEHPDTKKTDFYMVEPGNPNLSHKTNRILRSTDGGKTWQGISDTFKEQGEKYFYGVAVSGDTIYTNYATTGGVNGNYDYGVAVSRDGGKTWKHGLKGWDISNITEHSWIEQMSGSQVGDIGWSGVAIGLAVSKTNPDIVLNTNHMNAYISKDGGNTWQDTNSDYDPGTGFSTSRGVNQVTSWDVEVDPFDPDHMFFAYTDIGLFETFDGGKTFKRAHSRNGIGFDARFTNTCYGVEFDPDIEGFAVAAFAGIHDLNVGFCLRDMCGFYDQAKSNPSKPYGKFHGGVAITHDGGKTWSMTGKISAGAYDNDGVTGLPSRAVVTDIVIDPLSPKDVNRRVIYVSCMGFGVYKSEDGGRTYKKFSAGTEGARRQLSWRLNWNPDYSRLYITYAPSGSVLKVDGKEALSHIDYYPDEGPVYYLDRGETKWKKLNMPTEGLPANPVGLSQVAAFNGISEDRNGLLYGAAHVQYMPPPAQREYGGVWVTADSGANWKNIYNTAVGVNDIHVDSRNDNVLYICNTLNGQVLVSYKGAETTDADWILVQGMNHHTPTKVHEDPNNPAYMYVTTFGGGTYHMKLPYPVDVQYESADYSKVQQALDRMPPDLSIYTDDTVMALQNAVNAVIWGKDKSEQDVVDGYAAAIEAAIEGLELKVFKSDPADYTAVHAAIDSIPDDLSLYMDDGVQVLREAVSAVVWGLGTESQHMVDGYASDISNAVRLLRLKPEPNEADYTAVDAAIAKIPQDRTIYTDESNAALDEAVGAVVRGLKKGDQARVDAFAEAIETAIRNLALRPDTQTADYRAVDAAIGSIPADLSLYTDETVQALETAVNNVVRGLPIEEQETVDGFAAAIEDALANLMEKPLTILADYAKVRTALWKVPEDLSRYTEESAAALRGAVDAIQWDLPAENQDIVDGYAEAIEAAVRGLEMKYDKVVVQFDTKGGSRIASQVITRGSRPVYPGWPSWPGGTREFTGWYADPDCTQAVGEIRNLTIYEDTTFYAGWKTKDDGKDDGDGDDDGKDDGGNSGKPGGDGGNTGGNAGGNNGGNAWNNPFTDVKPGDWFYADVRYVYENGLFLGTSPERFSPGVTMNRGMLITVLGRMSGDTIAQTGFNMPFTDVDVNSYYAPYVAWATENGIIKGFDSTTFGAGSPMTREQAAVILYRYELYKNGGTAGNTGGTLQYADAGNISGWAREGALYAQENGIILGKPGNVFDPKGKSTRAETAAMLHRFMEKR